MPSGEPEPTPPFDDQLVDPQLEGMDQGVDMFGTDQQTAPDHAVEQNDVVPDLPQLSPDDNCKP